MCVHWTIPCKWLLYSTCVMLSSVWSFPASLSVDGAEDGVGQLARTLQSCLELSEPVQQIQLVKKVGFESGVWYNKKNECVVCCDMYYYGSASTRTVVCLLCTRQGPSWSHWQETSLMELVWTPVFTPCVWSTPPCGPRTPYNEPLPGNRKHFYY